ncbi:MAG: hypothetical protein LAP87_24810 [Acidobacteriia bacterium]|nr:hypothetical protein [Terriglobia bacterium]
MKRLLFIVICGGALAYGAGLADVHTVYVMPMSHGLDQYLANRLTNERVFQVVTDPKLADAIFTDQVGAGFQAKLADISPTPQPEKPAAKEGDKEDDKDADKKGGNPLIEAMNRSDSPGSSSSFSHGKGTVFLVAAKTREVVWSVYEQPKGSASKDMDRTASDIVSRLKKDLNPGKAHE